VSVDYDDGRRGMGFEDAKLLDPDFGAPKKRSLAEVRAEEAAKHAERKARKKRLNSVEWTAKVRFDALLRSGMSKDAAMAQMLADKLNISLDEARRVVADPELRKLVGLD
jgi:hypothetical protein